jgi:hypothetical protein
MILEAPQKLTPKEIKLARLFTVYFPASIKKSALAKLSTTCRHALASDSFCKNALTNYESPENHRPPAFPPRSLGVVQSAPGDGLGHAYLDIPMYPPTQCEASASSSDAVGGYKSWDPTFAEFFGDFDSRDFLGT